jgi:hypothetical protein
VSGDSYFISVPEAGRRFFGLKRAASYKAAARGEILTIKCGNRYVVPLGAMRAKFGLDPEPSPENEGVQEAATSRTRVSFS